MTDTDGTIDAMRFASLSVSLDVPTNHRNENLSGTMKSMLSRFKLFLP